MKKITIILTIIFSLLLIGATSNKNSLSSYNSLEKMMLENLEFSQNGVKVRYEVDGDTRDEYERLEGEIEGQTNLKLLNGENRLKGESDEKAIEAVIWKENDKTLVEISLINNHISSDILNLKQEITKLLNNKARNIIYFTFIKGKINSDKEEFIKNQVNEIIKFNKLEVLNISNGLTASGYLKSNERINLGYVGYDTGQYLIIGTPMIFVTY